MRVAFVYRLGMYDLVISKEFRVNSQLELVRFAKEFVIL